MSLLMEALRKAEAAKRKATEKQGSDPEAPGRNEAGTAAPDQSSGPAPDSGNDLPDNTPLSLLDNAELEQKFTSSEPEPGSGESDQGERRPDLHDYVNEMPRLSLDKSRQRRSTLQLDDEERRAPDSDESREAGTDWSASPDSSNRLAPDETETDEPRDAGSHSLESRAASRQQQLREQQDQQAASAMFRAKQAARQKQKQRQQMRLLVILVLLIPLGGLGFWLYDSLNSASIVPATAFNDAPAERFLGEPAIESPASPEAFSNARDPATAETTDTTAPANESVTSPDDAAPAVARSEAGTASDSRLQAQSATQTRQTGPEPDTGAPAPVSDRDNPAATVTANTSVSQPEPGTGSRSTAVTSTTTLRLTRTDQAAVVPPALDRAYELFLAGNNSAAKAEYETLLQEQPGNRDAMLGLASVHRREGQVALAQNLYARLLELNPRDPLARTALIETAQSVDPLRRESDLKALLDEYPALAPASFALGNLYASQQRWSLAQNAYYDALMNAKRSGGIVSPDYAFNLAVSLEQLRQPGPALDYYREALSLAGQAAPSFSVSVLNQRIQQLQQVAR